MATFTQTKQLTAIIKMDMTNNIIITTNHQHHHIFMQQLQMRIKKKPTITQYHLVIIITAIMIIIMTNSINQMGRTNQIIWTVVVIVIIVQISFNQLALNQQQMVELILQWLCHPVKIRSHDQRPPVPCHHLRLLLARNTVIHRYVYFINLK